MGSWVRGICWCVRLVGLAGGGRGTQESHTALGLGDLILFQVACQVPTFHLN